MQFQSLDQISANFPSVCDEIYKERLCYDIFCMKKINIFTDITKNQTSALVLQDIHT